MKKPIALKLVSILLIIIGVLKIQAWLTIFAFPMEILETAKMSVYGELLFFMEYILGSFLLILSGIFLLRSKKKGRQFLIGTVLIVFICGLFPGMIIDLFEIGFYVILLILLYTLKSIKLYFEKI